MIEREKLIALEKRYIELATKAAMHELAEIKRRDGSVSDQQISDRLSEIKEHERELIYLEELEKVEKDMHLEDAYAELDKEYAELEKRRKKVDAMEREVELKTQQYLKDKAKFEKEVKLFEEIKRTIADLDKVLEREIHFLPALIPEPPAEYCFDDSDIDMRFLRPGAFEVMVKMTDDCYMVCYFLMQDGYVHVACMWGDILDFVWRGFEEPSVVNPFYEVKPEFRRKYPRIASLFGQKEDHYGIPLPKPYITTIGFCGQPKTWCLSIKLAGISEEQFNDWDCGFLTEDPFAVGIVNDLRHACADIFAEIERSDAKKYKEQMHNYFGVENLNRYKLVKIDIEE